MKNCIVVMDVVMRLQVLEIESQPQNPEFRNNPEIFTNEYIIKTVAKQLKD